MATPREIRLGSSPSRFGHALVTILLGACGGQSSHGVPPSHANGGAASGAGGRSGSAGAADSGRGGAGFAGTGEAGAGGLGGVAAGVGGADSNAFPCGSAEPVIDATTGLEQCSGGYVRRVAPANCPSSVPRAAAVSGYNEAVDQCQFDADCAAADSPYAHCGLHEGGFAHVCVDGCVADSDCVAGRICLCGDPVGRCVPANCSTAADCASGFECAEYQAHPGCFSSEFACQTPSDRCGSDADCAGVSPNAAFCVAENGVRTCDIAQCTMP